MNSRIINPIQATNILAINQFQNVLTKERARSDRNGHGFSLAIFELGGNVGLGVQLLVNLLNEQIRETDEIGWVSECEIGVLLYNTPKAGAWDFINNVNTVLCERELSFKFSVQTYPDRWTGEFDAQHELQLAKTTISDGTKGGDWHFSGKHREINCSTLSFVKNTPYWKRLVDILGATTGMILFLPLMIVTAVLVKVTSKGEIIFKQKRIGQGGRVFSCYKFRSMIVDAEKQLTFLQQTANEYESGPAYKLEDDPRITPIGAFIRKWSIDELPQLLNVLIGDMSLVGPRPLIISEHNEMSRWHRYRYTVKPGLTCIWQVYGRHLREYDNRMRMDLKYVSNFSFFLDLKLLVLTIPAVLSRKGAC